MNNALFLFDNLLNVSTLASSSESPSMPLSNLNSPQRSKVFRSDIEETTTIDITVPDALAVDYLALVDCRLSVLGEVRVQAWSDSIGGTDETFDSNQSPGGYLTGYGTRGYGTGLYGGAGVETDLLPLKNVILIPVGFYSPSRYWRISITDAHTTYKQLSTIFIGTSFRPLVNLEWGWRADRVYRSVVKESIGGQRFIDPRASRLKVDSQWVWLNTDERTDFLMKMEEFGEVVPFIYSLVPENSLRSQTLTLYGRFESPSISERFFNQNEFRCRIIEEL